MNLAAVSALFHKFGPFMTVSFTNNNHFHYHCCGQLRSQMEDGDGSLHASAWFAGHVRG